jgi:hypothetical protein
LPRAEEKEDDHFEFEVAVLEEPAFVAVSSLAAALESLDEVAFSPPPARDAKYSRCRSCLSPISRLAGSSSSEAPARFPATEAGFDVPDIPGGREGAAASTASASAHLNDDGGDDDDDIDAAVVSATSISKCSNSSAP